MTFPISGKGRGPGGPSGELIPRQEDEQVHPGRRGGITKNNAASAFARVARTRES